MPGTIVSGLVVVSKEKENFGSSHPHNQSETGTHFSMAGGGREEE